MSIASSFIFHFRRFSRKISRGERAPLSSRRRYTYYTRTVYGIRTVPLPRAASAPAPRALAGAPPPSSSLPLVSLCAAAPLRWLSSHAARRPPETPPGRVTMETETPLPWQPETDMMPSRCQALARTAERSLKELQLSTSRDEKYLKFALSKSFEVMRELPKMEQQHTSQICQVDSKETAGN